MMHTQQIMLAERAHDKPAGKIGDAEAQDAKTGQQADDASRQEDTFGNDIRLVLAKYITDARQDIRHAVAQRRRKAAVHEFHKGRRC